MGSSVTERVAFQLDSAANTAGVTAMRTAVGQVGQDVTAANTAMAKSAADAAASQEALAGAAQDAQAPLQQLTDSTRAITLAQLQAIDMDKQFEASKRTTYMQVTDSSRAMTLAQMEAIQMNEQMGSTVVKTDPMLRRGAGALAMIAQNASAGAGSISGMAIATGTLATSLAHMSDSAKVAAAATGVGALVIVLALVAERLDAADAKTRAWATDLHAVGNLSVTGLDELEAQYRTRLADIQKQLDAFAARPIDIPFTKLGEAQGVKLLEQQKQVEEQLQAIGRQRLSQTEALQRAAAETARQAQFDIAANRESLVIEGDRVAKRRDDYQLSIAQNDADLQSRLRAINEQFRQRDAAGQEVKLTEAQIAQRNTLIAQARQLSFLKGMELHDQYQITLYEAEAARLQLSDNVGDQVQGKLVAIEVQRQAEIKATGDVLGANQSAELKKRQLFRDTAMQASADSKTIFQALQDSHVKGLAAVGAFGETIRRVLIGADAARSLVKAAIESAEAIASLAVGDFRGAALHGAAAASFGSAAALGAKEALGGGGGGGGTSSAGAGGGSGGNSSSTFTPTQQNPSQSVVVNLITANPYSGEAIGVVSYELQRADVLKRPIPISPTSGLRLVGAN